VIVALTGGTGFVGQAVIDRAREAGIGLNALTRREQPARAGIGWVPGDLADKAALGALVRGTEAVIHVAGVVNAPDAAGFEEGNVAGTAAMIDAARAEGIGRFVFVSSLSAREPQLSAYGASKARAEKLVKASGLDWTIVRPPAIYGPRDKEMFELFRAAKWGVVPVPASGSASVVHVDDLARLLLALVPGGEAVTGRMFEPDDGKPGGWDHYALARAIGWAVGRRPIVPRLGRGTLDFVAKVDMKLRGGNARMTLDRAAYFSHPDWVVSEEARPPVGLWQPRIETREGLKATARWYRDQRWL